MSALSDDIWARTYRNVMISGLAVLGAFLMMAFLAFFRARRFLEPLKIISDYAFTKNAQTISKYDSEKEIKPLKLPDGRDEIGELMEAFKKLTQGLSYLEENKEAESKKIDKKFQTYPKNYLRGKAMPWREELKKLQPKVIKQALKEPAKDNYFSRLKRSAS